MKKKCRWCKRYYNTKSETSLYCENNPWRSYNLKYKKMKPRPVKISAIILFNTPTP